MKALAKAAVLTAALLTSNAAFAQKWVTSGIAQMSSGVEGGGGRVSSMGRAQTRMRVGADLLVDERPEDIFGAAALVAFEPRTAFGFDLRYTRVVGGKFAFSGGGIAWLQPGSLVGPVASADYRMPLGKNFTFTAGPEASCFVLGTDLPDRTVIWQALLQVGLRVSL